MDSEKYLELESKFEKGESPSDEGPFYHHSWWEAYKGSIKGKVGGIVVGGLMGAILGAVVAGAMKLGIFGLAATATPAIGIAFAGLMGAGILYGMYEFGDIGKIVGAQAATQKQADVREAIRFSVLEKKIDALTKMVKGKGSDVPEVDVSQETEALDSYRKTHYAKLNGATKGPIFWKVALIGLAVGAAAGLILASGGTAGIAGEFLIHTLHLPLTTALGVKVAAATVMGLFGASFGINRDYFRKIFDTTDLWTKGLLSDKKVREHQEEAGKKFEKSNGLKNHDGNIATTITPDGYLDYPASGTFHRDRVLAATEKALLELDHTRSTPH